MNMKKRLVTLGLAAALGLFTGFAAQAATGDIYDICPCDENGVDITVDTAELQARKQNPFPAGTDLYFKIRLIAREGASGNRWYLKYTGSLGADPYQEIVQAALYPMQIGIYVSGRLEYATLVSNYETGNFSTALIFKYTTKPGDFALPIRLAGKTSPDAVDTFPATDDGVAVYAFNPLRDFWDFRYDLPDTDPVTGDPVTNTVACSWRITTSPTLVETGVPRHSDYTLEKCGFYVQTIDFSDDDEAADCWRSVHENSSAIGGGTVPKLVASAGPTNAVTLYVWSKDESVFWVNTDNVVNMKVDATGTVEPRHVGTVTFTGGQVTKDFSIYGAPNGSTNVADLVLSAYPQFNYSAWTGSQLGDFVTAKVKCIGPLPPSVIVECDRATAIANGNYTKFAAVLNVYLSQAYSNAVDVTLTPQFTDGSGVDWKQYLRFSPNDTIDEPMVDGTDVTGLPTVHIEANSTEKHTIYVFALRADTHTMGGAKVKFQSSIPNDPVADAEIAEKGAKSINIVAETTAITTPAEGTKAVSTTCNDEYPFTVAVSDTFADTHDAATGYQIYIKYRSSDTFVKLDGVYYVGDGGALYKLDMTNPANPAKTTDLPILKYTASGENLESQVYVVAPVNPNTGTAKKSEIRTFLADVKEARTVKVASWDEDFTEERRTFTEGDTAGFKITLSEKNETGETIYAYLKPSSNADPGMFSSASYNCIIGQENPEGLPINNSMQDIEGLITLLDGYAKPGLKVTFEVVLSSAQNWDGVDMSKKVPGYDSNYLTITINNVEPTIKRMEMNGIKATGDGYQFNNKLPSGQRQEFTLYVDDPGGYDLTNTNHPFQVRWTAMLTDGTVYDAPVVVDGDPKTHPFAYSFPASGQWSITAEVKDKDMEDWSEVTYTVYVTVLDQPAVEQPEEDIILVEKLSANPSELRKFPISVSYWDPKYQGNLQVLIQVSEASPGKVNPGTFKLDPAYVLTAADAQQILTNLNSPEHVYDANSDYYLVTLNKTALQQAIGITELDGTDNASIYGFKVQSFVVNGDVLPTSGAKANEYYLTSAPTIVYVNNLVPEFGTITLENTNAWKVAGGAATQYPIRWQVRYDVDKDWTTQWSYEGEQGAGIHVQFSGCQNAADGSGFIQEPQAGTFVPNFGDAQGEQTVTLTIEDKDGGVQSWTYLYVIEPSKFLKTYSTGPSGGTTTSQLSQRYVRMRNRGGLGEGHTYVAGATFSSAENFELTWNCSKLPNVNAFAFGYKVSDDPNNPTLDDGTLDDGRDIKINTVGRQNAEQNLNPYYPYAPADGKDSYFYLWILTTLDENGTPADIVLGQTISPEISGAPGTGRIPLPNEQTEDGAYLPTIVEAIFSREWRIADNLGDINQDGVPDTFATTVWGGGQSLIQATTGLDNLEGDLQDLAGGNPDEDYLPGVYGEGETALASTYELRIGGATFAGGRAVNSYAPIGLALNNRMELRGFHEGLNEQVLTTSDVSFSKAETNAYKAAFKAANGADWTDADGFDLNFWSPEPRGVGEAFRMDPTLEDTDTDSFPDGWEYYFWYMAHVWVPAGEKQGKPRGGQHFVFERFNVDNIVIGDEITADEVLARFHPCVPYDRESESDMILRYDFDKDGLADLEELVIGTNPCHWDTDGDRMCDGWEVMMCLDPLNGSKGGNPDGDFMAYRSVRLDLCWIDPAVAADIMAQNNGEITAENIPEGTRVYGPHKLKSGADLQMGVDYDLVDGKYVMLRTVEAVCYSFSPKFWNGERLVYGLREDIPPIIPEDWVWGWYMVDDVMCETITLNEGDELFPNLEYVLIHDQVRDGFGFDPRTAWKRNAAGYVSARWTPPNVSIIDQTGYAVNTRPYENYDEYLVMKYRAQYDIDYSPLTTSDDPWGGWPETIWQLIRRKTTNPNVVYPVEETEGEGGDATVTTNQTASASVAADLAAAFNASGSNKAPYTTHGADTDEDGVPDGWELYTYRDPNHGPITYDEDGLGLPNALDFDGDTLPYVQEYAGVDSCREYADCPSIAKNNPGEKAGWWNKFFPTNPGTMKDNVDLGGIFIRRIFALELPPGNPDGADTDLDGVTDGVEGGAWATVFSNGGVSYDVLLGFVYGTQTDDGLTTCFRGGGMNPCTIDTDLDGLPDGWEMQHAGVPVSLPGKAVVAPRGGDVGNVVIDKATFVADGIYAEGAALPSNAVYIAGGMDATWKGDAVFSTPENGSSYDELLGTVRDVDFDHDGLQNYQEYLTQAVRHFRYDDITTPLMGRQLEEGEYDPFTKAIVSPHAQSFGDDLTANKEAGSSGYPVFDPADAENFAANAAEGWDGRSFVFYQTVTTGVKDVSQVVDPYTGESVTRTTYYTKQVKKFKETGDYVAELVAKHVAAGGTALQQPWTADGWRLLGYFARPQHTWDRAIASGEFLDPLFMLPVTDNQMVGVDYSVAGYATTDPRMADTDGDGMDDFYEMFHGLNPLLGTTPSTADGTSWIGSKFGDIVSAQYYMVGYPLTDSRPTFNAWYNEWIYPTYSGLLGRQGDNPGDEVGAPIAAPQAYDAVLYPWSMGTPMVDADGDGIRNDEERIIANVADPVGRHTDPTPLWFTERTTPASYIAQYYTLPDALQSMPWGPGAASAYEMAALNFDVDATLALYNGLTYLFSFEENEGYDTDGDMTPDSVEVVSMVRESSDPLKFEDPVRRQAFYLPGENSYAVSRDLMYRPVDAVDFLKQFTVECWVMPERTGAPQTIVERSVAYEGDSISTDALAIRSNFRIGLDAQGKVYGMFDNNNSIESGLDAPRSCQFVEGDPLPLNEWTHVALTFNGSRLAIYINGIMKNSVTTSLVPANGITEINQYPGSPDTFTASQYKCMPSAVLIGARPKKQNVYALYPYYIEMGMHMESFDNLQEYFQGYVDELRVWDGARSSEQILANYAKHMGFKEAEENRTEVFMSWYDDGTRNNNDGFPNLPAELVLNYDFSTLPGAVNAADVVKTPAGFTKNVLGAAMSDYATNEDIDTTGLYPNLLELKGLAGGGVEGDLLVGWWNECLVRSTVYDDYHVVPWIKNTVSHLPLMDGCAPDSFLYADNFGASYTTAAEMGLNKFVFPNTAVPYPVTVFGNDRFYRLAHAQQRLDQMGEAYERALRLSEFQVRNNFTGTADLVPMGGAYAKTCPKTWDGGASDPWEQTGTDTDGDGIPDWWEEYARSNYAADPNSPLRWDTLIDYNGVPITAGKAYVIDIYRGLQPDGTFDPTYAVSTDTDGNNIPDWWENLFGVAGQSADADPDGDGLSNYAEYLISFGPEPYGLTNGWPLVNPKSAYSAISQKVPDYYLRTPKAFDAAGKHINENEYLGEIFTDHDLMESWWELTYPHYFADPYVYDPDRDYDEDGWDNWSEVRSYTWTGGMAADLIDRFYTDTTLDHEKSYPQPAVGLRVTYHGVQDVTEKPLVVRTSTKPGKRMDATFKVYKSTTDDAERASPDDSTKVRQMFGYYNGESMMRGFLHTGRIIPASVEFLMAQWGASNDGAADGYSWDVETEFGWQHKIGSWAEYQADVRLYGKDKVKLDAQSALEYEAILASASQGDGRSGALYISSTNATSSAIVGSIDYLTGEFEIDLSKLIDAGLTLDGHVFCADYQFRIGDEWPQDIWISEAEDGRIKQGKNTIEAFIDMNNNAVFDIGEPYGILKDVNVGWQKVPLTPIELFDSSAVLDRTAVGAISGVDDGSGNVAPVATSGLTTKLSVVREAINGSAALGGKTIPRRTVASCTLVNDDRPYLTEADVLTADKPDLDWKWLAKDATKLGLDASTLESVTYGVYATATLADGSTTEALVSQFTRLFGKQRMVGVTQSPLETAPVYSACPEFMFTTGDENATAYRLQVSTTEGSSGVIYDSGVKMLPGRVGYTPGVSTYSVSPELYVGAPVATNGAPVFADGSNYFWRVALLNAKYSTAELESDWSRWTAFKTDVANEDRHPKTKTGYGKCDAIVRYFGPDKKDLTGLVVVEAHRTADFAAQPLAQIRADVSQLDDMDDVTTVNASFAGILPGTVYLMAYIDANNNGRRDANESWGYANYIATEHKAIFMPKGVKVTDELYVVSGEPPKAVIYIEDTDANRNEIPDCIDEYAGAAGEEGPASAAGDSDRDGLLDEDEPNYATDASIWDSDGDGMPDGWEALFADLDPMFADAEEVADGDVMAFETNQCTIVTVRNTAPGAIAANYILKDGEKVPVVGDDVKDYALYAIYDYPLVTSNGVETCYGRGAETNLSAEAGTTNRVVAVSSGMVALVHAQVYAKYGFNPKTAVAREDAVNTKPFTALDKYLVIRYFTALGICDEDDVNVGRKWSRYSLKPLVADNDLDGVADGWELYVMFGTNAMGKAAFESDRKVSPWVFDDRAEDLDGETLDLVAEFDGGKNPTDPWSYDTDNDGVPDDKANEYHLKGTEGKDDNDGDGLSNYAEYLLTEVIQLDGKKFDPDNAFSANPKVSDYFYRVNQLYVGEIFSDHDRIKDQWESRYYIKDNNVSPYVYDENRDADEDGWTNYAEFQAGTDPTVLGSLSVDAIQMDEYPVPTIEVKLTYNGQQNVADMPVVVKAWSDPAVATIPDAVWTLGGQGEVQVYENGNSNTITGVKYFGMNPMRETLLHLSPGSVVPDSVKFEFKDLAWVLYNRNTEEAYLNDPATARWEGGIIAMDRNDGSGIGDIVSQDDTDKSLGTIVFATGEMRIDFSAFPADFAIVGDIAERVTGDEWLSIYNLQKSFVRVNWQSKLITGGNANTYYLAEADKPSASNNSLGHVKEGRNTFVAFYDLNADGQYTAGEPYGIATDVDVGWNYGKLSIELTDTTPVTARVCCMATGGSSAGGGDASDTGELGLSDREALYGLANNDIVASRYPNFTVGTQTSDKLMRIRVIRHAVDGQPCGDGFVPNRLVLDKVICSDNERYITEADFLRSGSLDLDWEYLASDLERFSSLAVTSVTYRIVMGDGTTSNNQTNNLVPMAFHRMFDTRDGFGLAKPTLGETGLVDVPSPTFEWSLPYNLGSYTAFRLQIRKEGGGLVWDSGMRAMPPRVRTIRESDGATVYSYRWTAPIFADDVGTNGVVFANNENYEWRVTVANARFKNNTNWSNYGKFRMNLPEGSDHGSARVAVRYYGPDNVARGAVIRVEAFKTPDFSGEPVSRGYVTNKADLASTAAITTANAVIPGLKTGSYYIRAYIDTKSDAAHERWESWGCHCVRDTTVGTIFTPKSVTVGPDVGEGDIVPVWIDDSDTDRDGLPDAWEWQEKGNLDTYTTSQIDQTAAGGFALKTSLGDTLGGNTRGTPGGLAVMVRSVLSSPRIAALIVGTDATGTEAQVNRALGTASVEATAEPVSVAITAIVLDKSASTVTISADTEGVASGNAAASDFYEIPAGSDSLELTCKVWHRDNLESGDWEVIETRTVEIGKTSQDYVFDLSKDVDLASGFFKVTLEK